MPRLFRVRLAQQKTRDTVFVYARQPRVCDFWPSISSYDEDRTDRTDRKYLV